MRFFDILADKGYIQNRENCRTYMELFTRLCSSYQLDFVHPEYNMEEHSTMRGTMELLMDMILHCEGPPHKVESLL